MATAEGLSSRLAARLRRLWTQAQVYFYYTGRPRLLNPISYLRRASERRALAQLKSREPLWRCLEELRRRSQSTGAQYADYWALYETITRERFHRVLECGSGLTTAVIALALKEVQRASGRPVLCVSMEEDTAYHRNIVAIFPDELRDVVDFRLSERIERPYGRRLGCCYRRIPEHPYEFMFIDGPTLRRGPGAPKCFNADLINVLASSRGPLLALIDQRVGTLWALKELLPGCEARYDVVRSQGWNRARPAGGPALLPGG